MMNVIKIFMIGFVQLTNSQAISNEGETCSGKCAYGLECVNTKGPLMGDSDLGICHPKC